VIRTCCFLPAAHQRRRAVRRRLVQSGAMLCSLLAGAEMTWVFTQSSALGIERQDAALHREYADTAAHIQRIHLIEQRDLETVRDARATVSLLEQVHGSLVLRELAQDIPDSVKLNLADLTVNGDRATLNLSGAADSPAALDQLMNCLSRSSLFSDVNALAGDAKHLNFQIEMTVHPFNPQPIPKSATVMLETN
jgi:Tfp pilus assembly protein PilN